MERGCPAVDGKSLGREAVEITPYHIAATPSKKAKENKLGCIKVQSIDGKNLDVCRQLCSFKTANRVMYVVPGL
jgi:hypothetical protein